MLGTLMKYEFKANGRILLPLYGAWIVVSIMLGLSIRTEGTGEPAVWLIVLSAILFAFVTVAAVVITTIILIQRFYKNLLGNEGYFMFALPVSTGQHITNKVLSGAIWTFFGGLAAIISGLAIAIAITGFEATWNAIDFVVGETRLMLSDEPTAFLLIIEVIIVAFLGMAETVAKIYAAISIGHQWSNHRVLGAILAYMGIGMAEGIVGGIIERIASMISFDWFYNMQPIAQSHIVMLIALAACAVMLAIYWFVSWKLLDKRLNLE